MREYISEAYIDYLCDGVNPAHPGARTLVHAYAYLRAGNMNAVYAASVVRTAWDTLYNEVTELGHQESFNV